MDAETMLAVGTLLLLLPVPALAHRPGDPRTSGIESAISPWRAVT